MFGNIKPSCRQAFRPLLILSTLLCLASLPSCQTSQKVSPWPRILEVEKVYALDPAKDWVHFHFPIRNAADSETLYRFVSIGGSTAYLDSLSDVTGLNYVGWLGCVLLESDQSFNESSLLQEDAHESYWHTRGLIEPFQLVGKRGECPEHGRVRHFRLRGMELTLEFFEIQKTSKGDVDKLKMRVRVVNRPDALSAIAEPSGYPYPGPGED